jgi:thiol-disulfide isomerase/thioredoxin
MNRRPLTAMVLCLTGLIVLAPLTASAAVPLGSRFTGIVLPDVQRQPVDIGRLVGQKVLLFIYWSLTCGQCAKDVPQLLKLAEKYRGPKFTVVFVNGDGDEMRGTVFHYMKAKNITWISVMDKLEIDDYEFKKRFRVMATPGVNLVDIKGRVRYSQDGGVNYYQLRRAIEASLAEAKK